MTAAVDDLLKLYGGTVEDNASRIPPPAARDLDSLITQHGGSVEPRPMTALQGGAALASGFNRGFFEGIGGLPVDTALNVADLARAAYGTVGRATGFLTPDEMPAPLNRSQYVGSSSWIDRQFQRNPYSSALVTNPRPDVLAARYLNAGGGAVGASLAGRPADAAMMFGSGLAGQAATEAGLPPSYAMLASMGPQAAQTGTAAAVRGALRGGEAGRQELIQRTQDFRNAGVTPTVGLATGSRPAQVIESALSRAPGGAGAMVSAADRIRAQLQDTANAARDAVSPVYGPGAAGDALMRGIADYRARQQDIYSRMNARTASLIPEGAFPVASMLARGNATLPTVPGAPNVTGVLRQPLGFTQDVLGALSKDAAPQPPQSVPSPILGPNGSPFVTMRPGTPGGLPFSGITGLKSAIGQQAFPSNPLAADANTGALKYLYSGAAQDARNAAMLADQQRAAMGLQPGAARSFDRANRFYSATQDVIDTALAPVYKAGEGSSEGAYRRMEADARNSGQLIAQRMTSLPLPARQQTIATVIDRLGRANPGAQTAEGDAWSSGTFLTQWNKLQPEAKTAMFSAIPNGGAVRSQLDYIAKAAERIKGAASVYANPSGTAGTAALLGAGAGIGSGAALMATGHYHAGLSTLGAILTTATANRLAAAMMTSPKAVTWLAESSQIPPQRVAQHLKRLAVMANTERDPQQRDVLQALSLGLTHDLGVTQ